MGSVADLIYLGRGRLHKPRANVVQSLHMLNAWTRAGVQVQGWFPPWRGAVPAVSVDASALDVRASQLLHPRWGFWPFVWRHRKMLSSARAVFTREARIAMALAQRGFAHTLELHEFRLLERDGLVEAVIAQQRAGTIAHIVTTTRSDAQRLIAHGAEAERVRVASNGVDWEAYARVPAFDASRLDRPRLVYIGRISRTRGLGVFEAVAERLDLEVTVVGELADAVQSERVEHVPFVAPAEVPGWYGRCDIALLPYQQELGHAESISPIKLFEAMAAGRPVVASRLPTIEEVIEHERTGLLVDPGDVDAWVQAVQRLQGDRALAERMATAAREQARQYSWQARAMRIARWMGLECGDG